MRLLSTDCFAGLHATTKIKKCQLGAIPIAVSHLPNLQLVLEHSNLANMPLISRQEAPQSIFHTLDGADPEDVDEFGFGGDAREFIERELAKTHESCVSPADEPLHSAAEALLQATPHRPDFSMATVLRAIGLRAKIQSMVFSVFMFLQDVCLVGMDGLIQPMELTNCKHDEIRLVMQALQCFEKIRVMDEPDTYRYKLSSRSQVTLP
ncbi:uncharacterized protein LY89DRAFT_717064 [Mollisia scopiformis]|uniref:Uncharacterized protein n=1 Tax=Mollisia scopiformis TaxID=149040 RepID=A0A194XHI1_MOLSC|nr:uncharacterized protein LY89DRAFT_717064 [Mollisia scopiformis]KUJ19591.1 hypothetical protein LY89DRAFT_717064 [Mollisia scopiformis]